MVVCVFSSSLSSICVYEGMYDWVYFSMSELFTLIRSQILQFMVLGIFFYELACREVGFATSTSVGAVDLIE